MALVDPVETESDNVRAPLGLAVAGALTGDDLLPVERHRRVVRLLPGNGGGQMEAYSQEQNKLLVCLKYYLFLCLAYQFAEDL